MAKRTVTFVLDDRRDRDILRWLDQQDNKSAAIREAIRGQIGRSGVTLGDVYEAIQDLRRQGLAVAGQGRQADVQADEPPDLAAALDRLGL